MKFINSVASILSTVFSPLLMATYGVTLALLLSFLSFIPITTQLPVILITFLATTVIPIIAIFLLFKLKVINDPKLNEKEDRTWPYIIETACFIGVAVYLNHINAPAWLPLFLIGGAIALIVLTLVNRRWKMSGHATGMGGLCALVFFLMLSGNSINDLRTEFLCSVILAGMVCSARVLSGRHTLSQVAAGFINGFVWVLLLPMLPVWLIIRI